MQGVVVPVERPVSVRIEARDAEGNPVDARARGAARAGRAARARPSRRRPDLRSHDARGQARGARRPRQSAAFETGRRGDGAARSRVLERLAADHDIEFLLTRPDRQRGRGRKVGAPPAKEAAQRLGIPVRQAERLDEYVPARRRGHDRRRRLRRADPVEPARPRELAERAPVAAPALARSSADRARDHGRGRGKRGVRDPPRGGARRRADRRLAATFSIGGDTTAGDVYAEAARLAPELIDEALANDSFSPQVGEPTYAEKIGPADRELDWSRPPKELHDRIRALSPHIGARGEVEGRARDRLARPARRRPPRAARGAAGGRHPHGLRAWLRGLRS